jgi:isoquinoline 1-oxidoreductase subunit alpha
MTAPCDDPPRPLNPDWGERAFTLNVNELDRTFAAEPDMPLLWVLRDVLCLTGTKYGCGIARCGACTVLVDGLATRSCVTPVSRLVGKRIRTIEGLRRSDGGLDRVQQAWLKANVPQCGYCQSGQIMATVALLDHTGGKPTPEEIDQALAGNLCRCGTYPRIRKAIEQLAGRSPQAEPVAPECS